MGVEWAYGRLETNLRSNFTDLSEKCKNCAYEINTYLFTRRIKEKHQKDIDDLEAAERQANEKYNQLRVSSFVRWSKHDLQQAKVFPLLRLHLLGCHQILTFNNTYRNSGFEANDVSPMLEVSLANGVMWCRLLSTCHCYANVGKYCQCDSFRHAYTTCQLLKRQKVDAFHHGFFFSTDSPL